MSNYRSNGHESISFGDRRAAALFAGLPGLSYDVDAPGSMVLHFNVRLPVDEVGGLVLNAGASWETGGSGTVELDGFLSPREDV